MANLHTGSQQAVFVLEGPVPLFSNIALTASSNNAASLCSAALHDLQSSISSLPPHPQSPH